MTTDTHPNTTSIARLERLMAGWTEFGEALSETESSDFPDPNLLYRFGSDVVTVGFDITAHAMRLGATVPEVDEDEADELEREAS